MCCSTKWRRRGVRPLLGLTAVILAACVDAPPGPREAIALLSLSGDLQSGTIGVPLDERLVAKVVDRHDRGLANATVEWSVDQGHGEIIPSRSRTDANGIARATWTLGQVAGAQAAHATVDRARAIHFSASAGTLGESCAGSPVSIPHGGTILLTGINAAPICIRADRLFTTDYLLVAFNTSRDHSASSTFSIEVEGQDIVTAANPPFPSLSPSPFPAAQLAGQRGGRLRRNHTLDTSLRSAERRELAPRVLRGAAVHQFTGPFPDSPRYSLSSPALGATLTLNANSASPCSAPISREGKIVAVTERAVIVEDTDNPAGGFNTAEYESIARTFDTLVYPVDVDNFGEPRDVDGNGRIVLFFTVEVNKLTEAGAPAGSVTGFFFARDLFPRNGTSRQLPCAGSNESELLYMMVPDPLGTINGNQRDKQFVLQRVAATMAHELQHLINASRRLHVNEHAEYPEVDWLDEGLSNAAEELLFFKVSGLSAKQELGSVAISQTEESEAAFRLYQSDNLARLGLFLEETNVPWLFRPGAPDAAARGAAAFFLRYVVDRMDLPERDLWRALANGPGTGLANLEAVMQADPLQWMRDWSVALFVDNTTHNLASRFRLQSWRIRSLMLGLMDESEFQLRPIRLQDAEPVAVEPLPGAAVYFRFGVPPSINSTLRLTARGTDLRSLSLVLLRTW